MAAMGERNAEDDDLLNIEIFFIYSWTEEEYHEAIADDTFYATVADKLDASSIAYEVNAGDDSDKEEENEQEKRNAAVKLKFYYAGGSCRLMFQCTTDAVKSALEAAARSTRNKMDLVNYCRSTIHSDKINVLYGMQSGGAVGRRYPVSSFAAYLMAEDCGEEVIAKLKKYLT
ncbi:hypothetical protein PHYSODRAFT_297522 [Phytophthora sojae]|uniref:Uncharacterized protein n=1 Tax=Phytophthora sojae (strain P6497) TaxID=1094619 RepID=G4YXC5_PHYSP|nr:hypothetical protein PHYSODRAFT_297522 [Phytophthora sojae]EGZ26159.1 hypothetical protein PHYSODRAFT_297522 [Phytophthora sojae]|eukprot:XP_009521447.1 hypothetical protein PHYSODRAFT_297522 [Phytophthora sojae]